MKISVITVTYNSAATLEETILSVIGQKSVDLEYILIDGQSTDQTLVIANKYRDKITHLVSEKDKGLYDALNKGIDLASGDVIAILHSDDFYTHPEVLSHYVKVFNDTPCDAVYADLYYVNQDHTDKIIRTWISGTYKRDAFLRGWMPPHPTFLAKKQVYDQFGKFDLTFTSAADYEWMLRVIHKHAIRLGYLPEVTVKMRVGGKSNQTMHNRVKANMEDRKAWEVNGLRPKWYTLYLKPLRKITQFFKR